MATLRRLLQGFQVPCAVRLWSMAQLGIYDAAAIAESFGALGSAPRAWEVPKLWFAASSLGFSSKQLLRSLESWSAGGSAHVATWCREAYIALSWRSWWLWPWAPARCPRACLSGVERLLALKSEVDFLLRIRRETARRLAAQKPRPQLLRKALQDFLGICWALNYCGVPLPDTLGIKQMAKRLESSRREL